MANTKSAAKQARASIRKRAVNIKRKSNLKKLEKEFRALIESKKVDEAKNLLPKLSSALNKAANRKAIHRNKASRKQSRLAKLIK